MGITKIIRIDEKDVVFKASAAIPRIYRLKFQRDIYKDLSDLQKAVDSSRAEESNLDLFSLELFENILEVRAVAGDNYLGGEDFTDVLEKLFLQKKGLETERMDAKTRGLVHKAAEECKLGFTENSKSWFSCVIDGKQEELEISLKEYEEQCEPLLDKIRKPVQRSL